MTLYVVNTVIVYSGLWNGCPTNINELMTLLWTLTSLWHVIQTVKLMDVKSLARTVIIFEEWNHKQWRDWWYEWFNMDNLPSTQAHTRMLDLCLNASDIIFIAQCSISLVVSQCHNQFANSHSAIAVPSNNLTQSKWLYCTVVYVVQHTHTTHFKDVLLRLWCWLAFDWWVVGAGFEAAGELYTECVVEFEATGGSGL